MFQNGNPCKQVPTSLLATHGLAQSCLPAQRRVEAHVLATQGHKCGYEKKTACPRGRPASGAADAVLPEGQDGQRW